MARQESINVLDDLTTPAGKMLLAEEYGKVIDNVQKEALSVSLKNTDLSGDPSTGSVEAKRFQNASSQEYGTARSVGKGNAVTGRPVTVKLNNDREFVEELEEADTSLLGVPGLIAKRAANHQLRMKAELDGAFFAEAKSAGTQFVPLSTVPDIAHIIELAIVTLETLKNDYIDGIDRSMMTLICNVETYSEMRNYLDTLRTSNVESNVEKFISYHGVRIESSNRLPAASNGDPAVKFVLMMNESIAQPVKSWTYTAERIQLSNAMGVSMFYKYGTKAVTPETIFWFDGTVETPTDNKNAAPKPKDADKKAADKAKDAKAKDADKKAAEKN